VHEKEEKQIDINKVILLGHSAGAYLALWICSSKSDYFPRLPFITTICVALAPIGERSI